MFTDAETDNAVTAFFCQKGGERIVAVYDQRHRRDEADRLFESFHCEIDLAVAVQLVAEEICEDHVIRLQVLKDMNRGGLIDFQAYVVCMQIAEGACGSCESGGDAFHHVCTKPVGDNTKPLCFEGGAQEIVGGRLAVGAAGDDDPTADLLGKRRDDMRVDFQGSSARKG